MDFNIKNLEKARRFGRYQMWFTKPMPVVEARLKRMQADMIDLTRQAKRD